MILHQCTKTYDRMIFGCKLWLQQTGYFEPLFALLPPGRPNS